MPIPQGVLPVLQTPFHEDLTLDYATLEREVDWVYGCGAHGLTQAMVSEITRLAYHERLEVARTLASFNRGRGTLVISVGAESTYWACRLAAEAQEAGADAVMATPPLAVGATAGEVQAYFTALLKAVSVPVIVQDASAYAGSPLPLELLLQLRAEWGSRVLFKPEAAPVGPVISALQAAADNKAGIYDGSGGLLLTAHYARGLVGTMPGADLVNAVTVMWQALEEGRTDVALRVQGVVAAILAHCVGLDGYLAVEKFILLRRGVFRNRLLRGPVAFKLDAAAEEEIARLLDHLDQTLDAVQ